MKKLLTGFFLIASVATACAQKTTGITTDFKPADNIIANVKDSAINVSKSAETKKMKINVKYPQVFKTKATITSTTTETLTALLTLSLISQKYGTMTTANLNATQLANGVMINADSDDVLTIKLDHFVKIPETNADLLVYSGSITANAKTGSVFNIDMIKIADVPDLIKSNNPTTESARIIASPSSITRNVITNNTGSAPEIVLTTPTPTPTPTSVINPPPTATPSSGSISGGIGG